MAKGKCVSCKKDLGGFFFPTTYACPACGKCYCKDCADKKGIIIKDLISPCCGRELVKV